jgi:hypothetical protein
MMRMKLKIVIILFVSFIVISNGIPAQNQSGALSYYEKMKSAMKMLHNARDYDSYKSVSLQLKIIAEGEKSKWVPYYHAAYAYTISAILSKEKFDKEDLLNVAQMMMDKADSLHPYNSEITALQGYIYQGRIGVDPPQRMKEYLPKAVKEYDKARFLDKENPRPYYLLGQILYKIPESFGGNKENACKHLLQALEKFQSFKPRSEFSPNWGNVQNEIMLKKCN